MPLKKFDISNTIVSELTALSNSPLEEIYLQGTYAHNLSPLINCPLKIIQLPNFPINLAPLKRIASLEKIILPNNIYSEKILSYFKTKIEYASTSGN